VNDALEPCTRGAAILTLASPIAEDDPDGVRAAVVANRDGAGIGRSTIERGLGDAAAPSFHPAAPVYRVQPARPAWRLFAYTSPATT
jgi:hypothetical protein